MANPTQRADRPLPGGVNAQHGQRRSNIDKRRAVMKLLTDDKWTRWSDREIARRCAVDKAFVKRIRSELSGDGHQIAAPSRLVSRGGKTYEMRTDKIGEGQKKTKEPAT